MSEEELKEVKEIIKRLDSGNGVTIGDILDTSNWLNKLVNEVEKLKKELGADRDSNPNVLEKVESFLKEYFNYEVQAFTTRNVVGDTMQTIYNEDGIQIDYCERYDYIEIFGLPLEDFYKLREEGLII